MTTTTMTAEIKSNSRSFIPIARLIVVCCCPLFLAVATRQSRAQLMAANSNTNSNTNSNNNQPQPQMYQRPPGTEQQQQQPSAASILAQIVNSAAQRQSAAGSSQQQPPLDPVAANQQQQTILNAAAQFGSSILGSPQQLNAILSGNNGTVNYREQGELLRQEIVRRAGHLQQVVASSHEIIKNSGDVIVARLLDQLNHRLNVAKSKADKIINEPTTNEVALRTLGTINQGLNNVNNIIQNIVSQNRSKLNFQQIGRQFSTALNAVQKQLNTQQQQQQLQAQQLT